jgi:hypothetical protein
VQDLGNDEDRIAPPDLADGRLGVIGDGSRAGRAGGEGDKAHSKQASQDG